MTTRRPPRLPAGAGSLARPGGTDPVSRSAAPFPTGWDGLHLPAPSLAAGRNSQAVHAAPRHEVIQRRFRCRRPSPRLPRRCARPALPRPQSEEGDADDVASRDDYEDADKKTEEVAKSKSDPTATTRTMTRTMASKRKADAAAEFARRFAIAGAEASRRGPAARAGRCGRPRDYRRGTQTARGDLAMLASERFINEALRQENARLRLNVALAERGFEHRSTVASWSALRHVAEAMQRRAVHSSVQKQPTVMTRMNR